ncbi:MAG: FtsQ-type POTRA domain-containing protein [Deltaproteobacteria bacterium]|nr:FtsQ-type POTRA domain-containing protein [Deltaproteobacteria bacterium]
MEGLFKPKFSTRKYRAKRRLGQTFLDILKALFLICAVLAVGAVMIYAYNYTITNPYFQIRETVVRGCNELTEKDILSLADTAVQSPNLLAINAEAISRKVGQNPWIKKVYIGRELPNRLVIEVRERKAVAVIRIGDELYLLDSDGVVFKKRENADAADLPILTGFYRNGAIDKNLLHQSLELLRHLAKTTDFPILSAVSEVHGDDEFGFSLYTNTGLCLQLGFDCYESKFKRLVPVLADLEKKNFHAAYLKIDLSDPVKITVKRSGILSPRGPIEQPSGAKNRVRA